MNYGGYIKVLRACPWGMFSMLWLFTGIIISYIIGSIPTGYIFGYLLKGIDIRKFGSGNVGATNAWRVLGKPAGITVLILDILKGYIPVVFLGSFLASRINLADKTILPVLLGLSCISGHNWTLFLGFKGGKGIATTLGVLFALSMQVSGLKLILLLLILTWVLVFIIARIISIASVLTSIALPVYSLIFRQSNVVIFLSILLCMLSILRHKSNLKRIFEGKESRLKFRK